MTDEEKIALLAHHFSEWTDDMAPLRIGEYRQAAKDLLTKYEIEVTRR